MAISEIPLNWEMLALVGTVSGAALAAGWAAGLASGRGMAQALREQRELLRLHLSLKEADLSTYKVAQAHSHERIVELAEGYAQLVADFKALASARPADEHLHEHLQLVDQLQARLHRYDRLREALGGSEDDVWNLLESKPPRDFEARMRASRLIVLIVANLKGGVGKTTLVANLAAYFAKTLRKRVLTIDFDYQGSLTRMMLPASGASLGVSGPDAFLGASVLSDVLLSGDVDGKWLVERALKLTEALPDTHLVTCGSTFEGVEFRLMVRGLLGDVSDDVRYRLANLLLSSDVQRAFDIVIIDAPPRSSAGALNGLFASQGLIIPTILDSISVDGVARFVQRAKRYRQFNPALDHIGVVATLTEQSRLKPHEISARKAAKLALADWNGNAHVFERNIRHFTSLAKAAGSEIGYLNDTAVKAVFDELGGEIVERFNLGERLKL